MDNIQLSTYLERFPYPAAHICIKKPGESQLYLPRWSNKAFRLLCSRDPTCDPWSFLKPDDFHVLKKALISRNEITVDFPSQTFRGVLTYVGSESTFVVLLPLEDERHSYGLTFPATAKSSGTESIVVVRNSEKCGLKKLLETKFKNVESYHHTRALDSLLKNPPALILCDMDKNGEQLLRQVRGHQTTKLIPFIAISSSDHEESRLEALENGADDYIVKPFFSREILFRALAAIQIGVSRRELEKQVVLRTKELQESEEKCRALAEKFTILTDLVPAGIFVVNLDGAIEYTNSAYTEMCGFEAPIPQEEWRDFMEAEDCDKIATISKNIVEFGLDRFTTEFRYTSTGKDVRLQARTVAGLAMNFAMIGCVVDITAQKELEILQKETAEQRFRDAEATRKQQERFIDIVNHELRNPLSGVLQNAECLKESLTSYRSSFLSPSEELVNNAVTKRKYKQIEEDIQAVDNILLCASQQVRIANDILNFSKLGVGMFKIEVASFNILQKLEEVVKMFQADCRAKSIELFLRKGNTVNDVVIEADPGRITQILANLVNNAITYMSESSTRKIELVVDSHSEISAVAADALRIGGETQITNTKFWVSIGVHNTGSGISPEELQTIHSQLTSANGSDASFGLHIVKQLVDLHQGFIEISSDGVTGSLFRVVIPNITRNTITVGTGESICSNHATGKESGAPRITAKRKSSADSLGLKVLIVEDNPINQRVLCRQLQARHMQVTVAHNGRDGLDKLLKSIEQDLLFDVVLMDIQMPVMTGLEAIKELRKMEHSGLLKKRHSVFALTGNARKEQIDECKVAGFDNVFLKPYQIANLVEHLRQAASI